MIDIYLKYPVWDHNPFILFNIIFFYNFKIRLHFIHRDVITIHPVVDLHAFLSALPPSQNHLATVAQVLWEMLTPATSPQLLKVTRYILVFPGLCHVLRGDGHGLYVYKEPWHSPLECWDRNIGCRWQWGNVVLTACGRLMAVLSGWRLEMRHYPRKQSKKERNTTNSSNHGAYPISLWASN